MATAARKGFLDQPPADKYTVWAIIALAGSGVVAVYSAISFLAADAGVSTEVLLLQHLIRVGIALGAAWAVSYFDYRLLARWSKPLLLFSLGLLLLVQLTGEVLGGAKRWLELGGFGFQPSDLARMALIYHVAVLLSKKQEYAKSFRRTFMPIFIWIGVTGFLIGLQDLSTAAVLVAICSVMCFIGRVSVLQLSTLAIVGLLFGAAMLYTSPQRAARLEAHLGVRLFEHTDSTAVFDQQAEGYQARQARIAFAMGGLVGKGPGKSTQRNFLPAPYNDFIFAIVGEEYGLVGVGGLLVLFVLLLFRGFLRIARSAPDPLGLFLAVGLTTTLFTYGLVHAAVSAGVLPVTGLPMPFVSYGGTALFVNGLMAGVLLNISRHARARA